MEEVVKTIKPAKFKRLRFTGNGFAFFKIWIVNIFLSILTIGIYSAWGKVRSKKYLYNSTSFAGSRFNYHAEPKKILLGRAIAAGLFLLYITASTYSPIIGGIIGLLLFFLTPFFMIKTIRFAAAHTSYRNIRFSFRGTIQNAYSLIFNAFKFPIILMIASTLLQTVVGKNPQLIVAAIGLNLLSTLVILFYFLFKISDFLDQFIKYIYGSLYYGTTKFEINSDREDVSDQIIKPYRTSIIKAGLLALALFGIGIYSQGFGGKGLGVILSILPIFCAYGILIIASLRFPYLFMDYVWNRITFPGGKTKSILK